MQRRGPRSRNAKIKRTTYAHPSRNHLAALPATALRGDVLPELVPEDGWLIQRDGKPR